MSSKKQRRSQRRKEEEERSVGRGPKASTLFILITVAALLAIGIGAAIMGDAGEPDSGQVWSEEHGHWH